MAKKLDSNKVVQKLPYTNDIWTLNEKAFRKEVSRLSAIANKRIERLIARDWEDSPALRSLFENGEVRFSVRGKSLTEVQKMTAQLTKFLRAETSTVRGAIADIKDIANITGVTYNSVKELKVKAKKFFELASKIKQYLKSQQDTAAALNYQKIWNQINQYTQEENIDLSAAEVSVDDLLAHVDEILAKSRSKKFEHMDGFEDFDLL